MLRPLGGIRVLHLVACAAVLVMAAGSGGCQPDRASASFVSDLSAGDFSRPRVYLRDHLTNNPNDRNYLLDRISLAVLTLADGYTQSGERTFEQVFDKLRTQGINADKTVASVVINEDVKFWKGEPFEQAMAFHYVGVFYGLRGDWANVRAAAGNALFHLRDFGHDEAGRVMDSQSLAERAAEAGDDDQTVWQSYTPRPSNFALGYLISAIANQQLLRPGEADEQFDAAVHHRPSIQPLVDRLRQGDYNAVFVVDYGVGPRKIGTGPDQAIADFVPMTASDQRQLIVRVGDREDRFEQVCDLNTLADELMWNNLEDIRLAKSQIGTLLTGGGLYAAGYGLSDDNEDVAVAGLGMLLAGLFAKGGAHADTRYCGVMPQRVYVVAASLNRADEPVTVQIDGLERSRFVLGGVSPSSRETAALYYLRLPSAGPGVNPGEQHWATSGRVHYANDHAPEAGERRYPYILGGDCVRRPTESALAGYQRAGHLLTWTLSQLQDLYRAEGIVWDDDDGGAWPGMHVLEGGRSLASPLPGSTGYARLFGQVRPPYQPRSRQVRARAAAMADRMSAPFSNGPASGYNQ